jgi:hypothetical protein
VNLKLFSKTNKEKKACMHDETFDPNRNDYVPTHDLFPEPNLQFLAFQICTIVKNDRPCVSQHPSPPGAGG